jgi:hypothetical protein
MGLPVPEHYDVSAEPTVCLEINEHWFSYLMGFFALAQSRFYWDVTDSEWADIEIALAKVQALEAICGGGGVPDYDSGWFEAALETFNPKAHGLGAVPVRVEVWHSVNADGSGALCRVSGTENYPDNIMVNDENIYCRTDANYVIFHIFRQLSWGWFRYLAWL